MKFSKTIFATALSALLFAQAAATTIVLENDMSSSTVQEAPLYELIQSMIDTLDKKKKHKKKDGKISVTTGVTAHVSASLDPSVITPEAAAYIGGALVDAYNEAHNYDDYNGHGARFVNDGLDYDGDGKVSVASDEDLGRPRSFRGWYRFSFSYDCRLCGDDLAMDFLINAGVDPQELLNKKKKSSKLLEWERCFCDKLQHCPFEELRDADGCKIEMDHKRDMANVDA